MKRPLAPILVFLSTFSAVSGSAVYGVPETDPAKLAAYLDRLASVSPRDAEAHAQLAKWCAEQGLKAEATRAYERAIAIDADCPSARAALGYVRYGTGWRLAKTAAARPVRARSADPAHEPDAADSADAPSPRDASRARPAVATKATSAPAAPPSLEAAGQLERKKSWAAKASERFGLEFSTYEDRDFLVHSTFSQRDREFKGLLDNLKELRKVVSAVLGIRSRTVIWPGKLQIVLLRSEPEYERFALNIDAVQSARNPLGSYTKDGHTVLWKPDGEAVARLIGSTALDQVYDSDRPVGWWLEDGVAEFVVAASDQGQREMHQQHAFLNASRIMTEGTESALIFKLLETTRQGSVRSSRNAALALTLTQFLIKKSRRGFTEFIKALKSDAAPPRPAGIEDRDAYLLQYVSFQEEALKKHFGTSVPQLGEEWTEYVLSAADRVRKEMEKEEAEREARERRARQRGRYR